MDRSRMMKELDLILEKHNVDSPDRESLLDDLCEFATEVRYEGYCDGKDTALRD